MASIGKVVQITVSLLTAGAKSAGFGIIMIADYHTRNSDLIRFYEDTDGMGTDGFVEGDAALAAVGQCFAQDPSPLQVGVGRLSTAPTTTFVLTPTALNNRVYSINLIDHLGAVTTPSYTSDGTATVAEIVAGLAAAINALGGSPYAAVDTGSSHTTVTVTATTGTNYFSLEVLDASVLLPQNTTADPSTSIANDLTAINLNNDSWYGLSLTNQGKAPILAAAAWAETNEKLLIQATSDGDCMTSSTSDVMSTNQTANRNRSALIYHEVPAQHAGAAWLGSTFPLAAGTLTFAFRQLANLDTSNLNPTQINNIEAKNGNYFTSIDSVSFTLNGKVSSGEWIDFIRDTDAFEAALGVAHLNVKLANDKVPMTDKGIAMEEAALRGVCAQYSSDLNPYLDPTTIDVTVPKVTDIPSADRKARRLNKLAMSATPQGAIQVTEIRVSIVD